MIKYTGDILIFQNSDSDYDIEFELGQPKMTDGFETSILYAVFGDKTNWQNFIANNDNEKLKSDFPDIINRSIVSNETRNNGTQALKNALNYLIKIDGASRIDIVGKIESVFSISWSIEIVKPNDESVKFFINWERGVIALSKN